MGFRDVQDLLDHGVIVIAGNNAEASAVAAAVTDAAAGRKLELHLLAATGLEEVDIGGSGADQCHRYAAFFGLAQGLQQVLDVDAGFAEQEDAVVGAEVGAGLVHADGHAHGGCQLRAGCQDQDAAALALFKVREEIGCGHLLVGPENKPLAVLIPEDAPPLGQAGGAAGQAGHDRLLQREG